MSRKPYSHLFLQKQSMKIMACVCNVDTVKVIITVMIWVNCVRFNITAADAQSRIVLRHVSCLTKRCTYVLVHPPAGSHRASLKRIRRPSEAEDVWDCYVNFAALALRVWHCSVPCFMPNETMH